MADREIGLVERPGALLKLFLQRPVLHLVDEVERPRADLGLAGQGYVLRRGGGGERKRAKQHEKASDRHERRPRRWQHGKAYHHDIVTSACGVAPVLLLSTVRRVIVCVGTAGGILSPTLQNDILGENNMPKALFVVRATVADASKRAEFDAWYSS